jgi:hypothetical protein
VGSEPGKLHQAWILPNMYLVHEVAMGADLQHIKWIHFYYEAFGTKQQNVLKGWPSKCLQN